MTRSAHVAMMKRISGAAHAYAESESDNARAVLAGMLLVYEYSGHSSAAARGLAMNRILSLCMKQHPDKTKLFNQLGKELWQRSVELERRAALVDAVEAGAVMEKWKGI